MEGDISEFCLEGVSSEMLPLDATLPGRELALLFGLLLREDGLAPGGGVGRNGDEDNGEVEGIRPVSFDSAILF